MATIDETLTGSRSSIVGAENDALDGDITNKLSKLKDLYERGLITQEEYEQKERKYWATFNVSPLTLSSSANVKKAFYWMPLF